MILELVLVPYIVPVLQLPLLGNFGLGEIGPLLAGNWRELGAALKTVISPTKSGIKNKI
jgi:hypothetical protein